MEQQQQQNEEAENPSIGSGSSSSPPVVNTKRSARMLYESSFATSFTAARTQKRPPGFVPSSLDYRSGSGVRAAGGMADRGGHSSSNVITTKPGRNSKYNKQQQQQQQQQYRSGQSQPTRAQGNFGPPPHSVKTLEDLENMSEEQIYKLFMDDPKLYETFIKTTEKGGAASSKTSSSSPVGAKKARRSAGKKPSSSGSSRSKRSGSSTKSKTIKLKQLEDREVPYFQWLLILVLLGVLINQARKAINASAATSTKDNKSNSVVSNRKGKGGKQKNKKGGKSEKKVITNKTMPKPPPQKKKDAVQSANKIPVVKSSSSKNKKKTASNSSKPKTIASVENKKEQQRGPELDNDSSDDDDDASSGNPEPERVSQVESVAPSKPTIISVAEEDNGNEQEWETVTRSSKGPKKEQKPKLDSSNDGDASSGNLKVVETIGQVESAGSSEPTTIPAVVEDNEQEWETVTKSSKGAKKNQQQKHELDSSESIGQMVDSAGPSKPAAVPVVVDEDNEQEWKTVTKSSSKGAKKGQQKSELEWGDDVSSGNPEPETVGQVVVESVATSNKATTIPVVKEDNDQEWETVIRSSKGAKKGKKSTTTQNVVEEKKVAVAAEPMVETKEESAVAEPDPVVEKKTTDESGFIVKKTKKKKNEVKSSTSDAQPTEVATTTSDEVNNLKKSNAAKKGEPSAAATTTTDDDAALAMQLHKQEINLARSAVGNPQEEAWEEVTSKKKKVS
mmetsp:Transcript_22266/g.45183  ORF Transcript_22266/g.45183 Transcript_22266/m.45183 type:complete len:731 (+) Transcript_22266:198-2390(+)|eukprot:CAMPEP_0168190036 /NCGR_PEP_ID=MMETSP0139_2-20121125/16691_1 /TAXON_ID=44445 /ORGANISM="Pseudo-nitzschia australis, Strain 10249 10 AB" /LENGTH=730 /DNA_ID=CAMNT_0008112963 /DNA_START=54 /DNA_END=2249 /DNA_ORIENTATION=-